MLFDALPLDCALLQQVCSPPRARCCAPGCRTRVVGPVLTDALASRVERIARLRIQNYRHDALSAQWPAAIEGVLVCFR